MSDERRGGGGIGAGFVLLLFVGVVVKFWLWILAGIAAAAAIALVFYLAHRSDKRYAAKLDQLAAIVARADQQHAWILAGDDRGVHGDYPPAVAVNLSNGSARHARGDDTPAAGTHPVLSQHVC